MVGANRDDIGANPDQGSAYVFTRSGSSWNQQQKLTASDGEVFDLFGYSVAIAGDTAVVGAYLDDVGAANGGSAYVFTRSGSSWSQQQQLTADDGAANDQFGVSVAIAGDTAVVGAFFDDVGANLDQGSAYVFTRSGSIWSQQQQLTAGDGAANDQFGTSVAIAGGGVVVGAPSDDSSGPTASAEVGSVYVYRFAAPTLAINDVTATEGNGDTSILNFTVTRTGATESEVGFSFATADSTATTADSDYVSATGTGTISAGGATSSTTVSVTINGDAMFENNESFFINLSAPTNATISDGQGVGTINNDDAAPMISVNALSVAEGNAGTSAMNFVVSLSPVSGRDVSFTATTADGTATIANNDYVALTAASVTILAGQTSVTIPVTINGDTVFEGNETLSLNLSAAVNATPASLSGTGTITEDDQQPTATTIVSDLPDPTVTGQSYVVSVQVAGQSSSPTGTVNVSDGAASCVVTLSPGTAPNSAGNCTLISTTAGSKTLTATYVPASTAFGPSSNTGTHQVNAAATTLTLTGPATARINTATSFSVQLQVSAPGAGSPAGTVTLTSGASSCQITFPTVTPSCNLSFSSVGSRSVSASFVPSNTDFVASSSNSLTVLVFAQADLFFQNGFESPAILAATGSFHLPGTQLRSAGLIDGIARRIYGLDDANGEALRVYARVLNGETEYALATRSNGTWSLAAWQAFSAEPTLSWTARQTSAGFVLQSANLR